jgi:hypothetical protein
MSARPSYISLAASWRILACIAVVACAMKDADARPLEFRTVALSGEPLGSALTDGALQAIVGTPVIDNHGNIAFIAALASQPSGASVWVESDAALRLIARTGDVAPTTGAKFSTFSDVVIADTGATAFRSNLSGTVIDDYNRESLWLYRDDSLSLITQAGKPAPNFNGDFRFFHFETPIALNSNGQLAMFARTLSKDSGTAQSSGIWATGTNNMVLAASEGMTAIEGQPDIVFLPQSFEQPFSNDPVISPAGQTVFRGFVTGPGVTESSLNGLWSYRSSAGLELLVRAGEVVTGMEGTRYLSFPGVPTINAAGDTAFLAFVGHDHEHVEDIPGGNAADLNGPEIELGLWLRRSSGELSKVFAIGDHAPGIEGVVQFADTFDPVMNAASRVAFVAAVDGEGVENANEMGLWSNATSPDGSLHLIARQGDQAPGREPGFVFGVFLEPSLNADGQTAFMASGFREVNGLITENAFGIWGQDRVGRLRLVASVGDMLEVSFGDYREIASLVFASATGGEDGKARGLNDAGQIVFRATFSDGSSGVFVSDALTVPEPPLVVLVLIAAGLFCCRQAPHRTPMP